MKFLSVVTLATAAAAELLTPVMPATSSLRHKRQTITGPASGTVQGGGSSSGSSSSLSGSNSGSLPSQLPFFNITNFSASSNSKKATYSFDLAYYPGQPTALCQSQETSWSGFLSYTEANCTNDASLSTTTPLNAFRIDPQDDGSLDIYVATIYPDYAKLCSSCVEAANGTITASSISTTGNSGASSVSGQKYTGATRFSLATYLA